MDTNFLTTQFGFLSVVVLLIVVGVIVFYFLNKINKYKGNVEIGKGGIKFSSLNLTKEIPKIDKKLQEDLYEILYMSYDIIRASLRIEDKIIQSLVVCKLFNPLENSIQKNHLIKNLSDKSLAQDWIEKIIDEFKYEILAIENYCDIKIDESIFDNCKDVLNKVIIPRFKPYLYDAACEKIRIYENDSQIDETKKQDLIIKNKRYLEGL